MDPHKNFVGPPLTKKNIKKNILLPNFFGPPLKTKTFWTAKKEEKRLPKFVDHLQIFSLTAKKKFNKN